MPDPSKNLYVTNVVPTGKDDPGAWDLLRVGATTESSVAVGSVQIAVAKLLPTGAWTLIALRGHPVITGGTLSTPG